MRDLAILVLHLAATVARLASRGGGGSLIAESGLVKHQLLVHSRSRHPPISASLIAWSPGLRMIIMRDRMIRFDGVWKPDYLTLRPRS